jgi:hypothetical protein
VKRLDAGSCPSPWHWPSAPECMRSFDSAGWAEGDASGNGKFAPPSQPAPGGGGRSKAGAWSGKRSGVWRFEGAQRGCLIPTPYGSMVGRDGLEPRTKASPIDDDRVGRRINCDSRHSSAPCGRKFLRLAWPPHARRGRSSGIRPSATSTSGESSDYVLSLLGCGPSTTAFRQPNRAGDGVLPTHCRPRRFQEQMAGPPK